ncbi:MAG: ABC transporter permease [Lentimicrobiaceae bacterium]|jgi:lipoprotein-releasing system permease protein|nr:ABC transporter permease [Lentimicrobiaceae bacterium]
MKPAAFIASRIFSLSRYDISSTVMRIAVISVAIGLAVMLVSVAIVMGFKNQIREKVLGFVAPIHIQRLNNNETIEETPIVFDSLLIHQLEQVEGIDFMQCTAHKMGIIKTDDQIQGCILKGVGSDYNWLYFEKNLVSGTIPEYHDTMRSDKILISKKIAEKLTLDIDDPVRMWFIDNAQQARGRRFIVSGIYETGLTEFDERYLFGDMNQIRRLNEWNNDAVGVIEIWTKSLADVNRVNEAIYFSLPIELASYSAMETYPHIFDWLDLQDMNVVIIIILMVLVSGITMISMLLIIILERTSTIGLLKSLGATNGLIAEIFLFRSFKILLYGLLLGNFIGIGFCLLQHYTGFISLPSDSYYLSSVPIDLSIGSVLIINASALLLWFSLLLIPTTVISKIVPSKSLKFD